MRVLKFNINAQQITKAPDCDFSKLVAGTSGYLRAHFTFSPEWDDCVKIAQFWRGTKEHAVLIENGYCDIPSEALTGTTFKVSVLGRKDKYRIPTNKVIIRQGRGYPNNGDS